VKRIIISCGGTGGHLSPGISLAEGLSARGHEATLLISHKKVDTRLITKYEAISFQRIPGSPFSWRPIAFGRFLISQTAGFLYSFKLVRSVRPDGIVGLVG